MLKNFVIFLISVFLLCGCTNNCEKEVVTFSTWGSVTEVSVLKQLISDFEKENPDIKIQLIHTPQNYFQKLHLLFASNTPPDVIFINNLYLPIYESQLENLSEFVNKKEFYQQALDGLTYDKKLLAIPRDISNLVLYVNKDLISVKTDWSLEEMLTELKKTTNSNVWGISFEEDIYWAQPYLAYYGEEFNQNYNSSTSKGLIFYKNLRDLYKVAPTKSQIGSSTLAQMFLDKKIALYLSGRWLYPKIKEQANFNWEIASFPQGKSKTPCDSSGWAISKNSKHKDSAIKFVKYLSGQKGSEYFTKTGLIVPARIESAKVLNTSENNEKVFLEVIKNSKNTFVTKNYKRMVDNFNSQNFN